MISVDQLPIFRLTSGISGQTASSNNLNVTVHIIFKNRLDEKNFETDITRNFRFLLQ